MPNVRRMTAVREARKSQRYRLEEFQSTLLRPDVHVDRKENGPRSRLKTKRPNGSSFDKMHVPSSSTAI